MRSSSGSVVCPAQERRALIEHRGGNDGNFAERSPRLARRPAVRPLGTVTEGRWLAPQPAVNTGAKQQQNAKPQAAKALRSIVLP